MTRCKNCGMMRGARHQCYRGDTFADLALLFAFALALSSIIVVVYLHAWLALLFVVPMFVLTIWIDGWFAARRRPRSRRRR